MKQPSSEEKWFYEFEASLDGRRVTMVNMADSLCLSWPSSWMVIQDGDERFAKLWFVIADVPAFTAKRTVTSAVRRAGFGDLEMPGWQGRLEGWPVVAGADAVTSHFPVISWQLLSAIDTDAIATLRSDIETAEKRCSDAQRRNLH